MAARYHNDSADIVSLLCLKAARSGGLSSFASSITVHNEILKRRPDLARVFAGDWYFDRKGEVPPGKKPFFAIPVFNYHEGYLSVNYSDNYYLLSQRHAEVPRLTKVRGACGGASAGCEYGGACDAGVEGSLARSRTRGSWTPGLAVLRSGPTLQPGARSRPSHCCLDMSVQPQPGRRTRLRAGP